MIDTSETLDLSEARNGQRSNDDHHSSPQQAQAGIASSVLPGRQPTPTPPVHQVLPGPYNSDELSRDDLNGIYKFYMRCK